MMILRDLSSREEDLEISVVVAVRLYLSIQTLLGLFL
jgi:hypothetical protein